MNYAHTNSLQLYKTKAADSSYMRETAIDLLGNSLIVMDGAEHMNVRSALNPAFHPKGLTAGKVGEVVAQVMGERMADWGRRTSVPVVPDTREIALDIIFRMIGIPSTDLTQWRRAYEEFLFTAVNIPIDLPGFPNWRGRRASVWLRGRLQELVRKARQKEEAGDLLERLSLARGEDGELVDEGQLVDNIRLLALAGHETTASTMAWMTIHLGQNPRWWDALVEEARSLGKPPTTPTELRNYPVAESIFRESLRMHPPVANDARVVVGSLELEGRKVPVGTIVGIPIYLVYRDPEAFPDPDIFHPERWTGKEGVTPLETIGFGSGPNFCLGYHVPWLECVHFAARLALNLSAEGKRPLAPPQVKSRYVPFIQPDAKVQVQVV